MNIEVRRAIADDADELIALNRESDVDGEISLDPDSVRRSITDESTERVFVAELQERLVGFATVQITRSFCYTRPTAELTELFVRPEQRRLGAASKLVAAIISDIEIENSLELFLRVNHVNTGAISFYERNGFSQAAHYEYRINY